MQIVTRMALSIFWVSLGLVLAIYEFLAPRLIAGFFAAAAFVTALFVAVKLTPSVAGQVSLYIVITTLSIVLFRSYFETLLFGPPDLSGKELDRQLLGKEAPMIHPHIIDEQVGRVLFDGVEWNIHSSANLETGNKVQILERRELTLIVQKKPDPA